MTYVSQILALAPYSYWRLNESSGAALADSSGNGNAGTLNQGYGYGPSYGNVGPIIGDSTSKAMGIATQATGLTATNNTIAYWPSGSGFTTVFWANLATLPTTGRSGLHYVYDGGEHVYIGVDSSGHVYVETSNGGSSIGTTTSALFTTSSWHMVAVTLDGSGNFNVYLDGGNILSTSIYPLLAFGNIIYFGNAGPSSFAPDNNTAPGSLWSECAYFNATVLSAAQIATLYGAAGILTTTQQSIYATSRVSITLGQALAAASRVSRLATPLSFSVGAAVRQSAIGLLNAASRTTATVQATFTSGASIRQPEVMGFGAGSRVVRTATTVFAAGGGVKSIARQNFAAGAFIFPRMILQAGAHISAAVVTSFGGGAYVPLVGQITVNAFSVIVQGASAALNAASVVSNRGNMALPAGSRVSAPLRPTFGAGANVGINGSTSFGAGAFAGGINRPTFAAGADVLATGKVTIAAGARLALKATFAAGARLVRFGTSMASFGAGADILAHVVTAFAAGGRVAGGAVVQTFTCGAFVAQNTPRASFGAGAYIAVTKSFGGGAYVGALAGSIIDRVVRVKPHVRTVKVIAPYESTHRRRRYR